jgi:predicted RNase H-like HicB family nuclease
LSVEVLITEEMLAEARRYSLLIAWSERDRAYIVSVPELPGCMTHGASHAEAVEMAEEAIATYLAGLRYFGDPIPAPHLADVA